MNIFLTGTKQKDGPYTTDHILLNGEEILTNIEHRPREHVEPFMNRTQRRLAAKGKVWCKKCGINWLRRFDEWSQCTVWPDAKGHEFI